MYLYHYVLDIKFQGPPPPGQGPPHRGPPPGIPGPLPDQRGAPPRPDWNRTIGSSLVIVMNFSYDFLFKVVHFNKCITDGSPVFPCCANTLVQWKYTSCVNASLPLLLASRY